MFSPGVSRSYSWASLLRSELARGLFFFNVVVVNVFVSGAVGIVRSWRPLVRRFSVRTPGRGTADDGVLKAGRAVRSRGRQGVRERKKNGGLKMR